MMVVLRAPFLLLRLLLQSALLALGQIWANKARATLTTVGIVISVAAVTTVIAVLTGMKANVLSEFEQFGTNKIYIVPHRPEKGPLKAAPWHVIRFMPDLFEGLKKHCPSVDKFTPVVAFGRNVRHGDRQVENVQVVGVSAAWHDVENRAVELGRSFTVVDEKERRPVCLVTPPLRDKLRLERDCTGMMLLVGRRLFTIVGVVEKQPELKLGAPNQSECQILIPHTTAWKMEQPWLHGIATSRSPEVSEEAAAEIRFYLRRERDLNPGEPDTFRLEIMEKYLREFSKIALAITIVASGIVGISLVVGGVGIMNIMLVSVSERTREIGLRKAVGARPSAILLQFLVEAVMLCFFGGLIGLAVGQGLTSLMAGIPQAHLDRAHIPFWAVALSFGFAALVGLVFGMAPAVKAARLDPIEALRHE